MPFPLTTEEVERLRRKRLGPSGNRVQAAIKLAGSNQTQLAIRAGVSVSYVADIARGRYYGCSVDTAHKFADAIGCTIADLFPRRAGRTEKRVA